MAINYAFMVIKNISAVHEQHKRVWYLQKGYNEYIRLLNGYTCFSRTIQLTPNATLTFTKN